MRRFRERTREFLSDYGKVFFVFILVVIFFIFSVLIFYLLVPQKLKISFLDVGQGDAIFIETPSGHQMLVDGGATNIILDRLTSEINFFDRGIDVVVATHPDADHVTGLIPVLEKFNVDKIISSVRSGETGTFEDMQNKIAMEEGEEYVARSGDVINFHDGVTAEILFPTINYNATSDTNDASISMVIKYGDQSFLLTGDLPSKREPSLITSSLPKNITVYKAGHHGSNTSSGEQLLSYIKPEYAVISAGKDNKYGHPNIETIGRLQKYSKEILSTIESGTITFITDGKILEVETKK